jgi:hypothetical protein
MSQPPNDHPHQPEHQPQPFGFSDVEPTTILPGGRTAEVLSADGSPATPQPAGRGRRRGVLVGAGVLVVALVGGGAALAASKLSGGGTQPDEVVPASAVAFVSVDLDPSAGQKIDALRFARKFPSARSSLAGTDDLRKALFTSLTKDGSLHGSYAQDVEPWLGQRAGLAVLPPAKDGDDPGGVVVLAVTDKAKAEAGIAKVTGSQAHCTFTDDFAVCSDDAAVAAAAVSGAKDHPLSDASTYSDDVDSLGGRGIAQAWVDLARLKDVIPDDGGSGPAASLTSGLGSADVKGRAAVSLRFDGAALELVGSLHGAQQAHPKGAADVGSLPADTIAAVGLTGADQAVGNAWKAVRQLADGMNASDQLDQEVQAFHEQFGISVPQDVQKALGQRVSIAFGGVDGGTPKVAAKVSGDRPTLERILTAVQQGVGQSVASVPSGDDTVLATDESYAHAVASGSGLGSSTAFTDAAPDAKDAQVVAFVNLARLYQQLGDTMDLSADDRKNVAPLSAVGITAKQSGDGSTFRVRLTTR